MKNLFNSISLIYFLVKILGLNSYIPIIEANNNLHFQPNKSISLHGYITLIILVLILFFLYCYLPIVSSIPAIAKIVFVLQAQIQVLNLFALC